jgi:hypothetical protein
LRVLQFSRWAMVEAVHPISGVKTLVYVPGSNGGKAKQN